MNVRAKEYKAHFWLQQQPTRIISRTFDSERAAFKWLDEKQKRMYYDRITEKGINAAKWWLSINQARSYVTIILEFVDPKIDRKML
jgi:hypothetical protein